MADDQKQLQTLSDEYTKLQGDLQVNIDARQRLESQLQENTGVQMEFLKLAEDANIYKLVGPVLLKQDHNEAALAVNSRLAFIENEIQRVEKLIQSIQEESDTRRMAIYQLQTRMQSQQAQAVA